MSKEKKYYVAGEWFTFHELAGWIRRGIAEAEKEAAERKELENQREQLGLWD